MYNKTEILEFIRHFKHYQHEATGVNYLQKKYLNVPQIIEDQFVCGYCYQFAHMLNFMFPDDHNKIIYIYPHEHFVFMHNDITYDIRGEFDIENCGCLYMCNEHKLPDWIIETYRHDNKVNNTEYLDTQVKKMDYFLTCIDRDLVKIEKKHVISLMVYIADTHEKYLYLQENSEWYNKFA